MAAAPQTKYAKSDGLHIAYQVAGDGPHDVVVLLAFRNPMDMMWDEPNIAEVLRHLTSFGRVILHDRRGTGDSDRVSRDAPPSLEDWVADATAVMDEVGSESAWLVGIGMGGAIALLMAATKPERVRGLVLVSALPKTTWSADFPWGLVDPDAASEDLAAHWGVDPQVAWRFEDQERVDQLRDWVARSERRTTSPSGVQELIDSYFRVDVVDALPLVQAPTLLVSHQGSHSNQKEISRFIAERLANARLYESPHEAFFVWAPDRDAVVAEIEEFVTGTRPVALTDRVLATILFTDVVESTQRAHAMGDAAWRALLDSHDAAVATEVERYRGTRIKHTGDGILAMFDGPARAVRCAHDIQKAMGRLGLEVRAGVHVGEVERRGGDISGIGVHIGQRVSSLAGPGEVLVSQIVTDLVAGSGLTFEDRGEHELKGVPGRARIYAALS